MLRATFLLALIALGSPLRAQELAPVEDGIPLEFPSETPAPDRVFFRTEYLHWYLRQLRIPPLLTTGPEGSAGILGEEGTTILRGGRIQSRHDRYIGVRAIADWWFGSEREFAFQADLFFLERDSTHFTVRPGTVPVLAIPFFDNAAQTNSSYVVSGFHPEFGPLVGGTRVYSRMELFGQEANALWNMARTEELEWNVLAGGRFLQLRERLDLTSSSRVLPEGSTLLGLEDHFQTFDKFYGGQVGVQGKWQRGRFRVEGKAALALGADDQTIRNKGIRIFHTPQQRQVQDIGLFVRETNRGQSHRMSFDTVTELRWTAAYQLTRRIHAQAGYTLLTWAGPVRVGDQAEGIPTPRPQFTEDFFWAHGANVGLEWRW